MQDPIEVLENKNAELAKEILLNESAIYETDTELSNLDQDLLEHPKIKEYIVQLRSLIDRLESKNERFKNEIYQNNVEIKRLRGE